MLVFQFIRFTKVPKIFTIRDLSIEKKVGKYYVAIQNAMHFENFRAYIGISKHS
jgi:hypothetical protein